METLLIPTNHIDGSQHDGELCLLQLSKGDARSFSKLYKLYYSKVKSQAMTIVKLDYLSEEVAQDVFTKLWSKRELLPEIENLEAFLYTMTRNFAISAMRRLKVERELMMKYHFSMPLTHNEHDYCCKELEAVIHKGMERMQPKMRQVFKLVRSHGLKRHEVAQEMEISPNTVKQHMQNAMRNLKKYVGEEYGEKVA